MTTTDPTTSEVSGREPGNRPLVAARIVSGLAAALALFGVTYFTVFAREEAQFMGPWVDVPLITWKVAVCVALLTVALAPGLRAATRVQVGIVAAVAELGFTAIKVAFYDEPEAVTFAVLDLAIIGLLVAARRRSARLD